MIKINFRENQLKDRFEVTVSGHAEAAEKGEDLICASASILSLTLVQTIKCMEQQDFFVNPPRYKVQEGYTQVVCKPKPEYLSAVVNSLATIKVGFGILSEGMPSFVELTTDVGA